MARRRRPPLQGWKAFLHNHVDAIASIDMFVVPTISFRLLFTRSWSALYEQFEQIEIKTETQIRTDREILEETLS
jgi:hypothetical protein